MRKVNLIGHRKGHDLILKDRAPNSPGKKGGDFVNLSMEKPILDISKALNRGTTDPRTQALFVNEIKQACLDFNRSPIIYKRNQFDQSELLRINEDVLIKVQSNLGQAGQYE